MLRLRPSPRPYNVKLHSVGRSGVRGEVLSYDARTGDGLISGDDGARYAFDRYSLLKAGEPSPGRIVDFLVENERAVQMVVLEAGRGVSPPPAWEAPPYDIGEPAPRLSSWGYFVRCSTRTYFDGAGRAGMTEYWSFVLIHLALMLGLGILGVAILVGFGAGAEGQGGDPMPDGLSAAVAILMLLFLLFWLYFIVPSITALARRLHDMGQSAFWILIGLVPFGGLALLVMSLMGSQPGPNRFGPRPL